MGTTAQKLEYLGTTKSQLKTMISYGYPLSNETFREYVGGVFKALINSMTTYENPTWNNLPKLTTTPGTTQSINNTTEAPMKIELGANELSQSATPTPSSPQAIHTIRGENTIKVEGLNVLNPSNFVSSTEIPSIDRATNIITININSKNNFATIFDNLNIPIGNYTIWAKIESGTYTGGNLCYYDLNDTKYTSEFNFRASTYYYHQFNASNGLKQLRIYAPSATSEVKLKLWIVRGSYTTNTMPTYEPYKGNSYKINLGKNISDFGTKSVSSGITINTNDIMINNPTNYKYADNWNLKNDTSLSGATYTIYAIANGTTDGTRNIQINIGKTGNNYAWQMQFLTSQTTYNNFVKVGTITLDASEVFTYLNVYVNGSMTADLNIKVMVVKGSYTEQTIGDYEPYFTPIEYCKIGDYKDEFIRTTGKNLLDNSKVIKGRLDSGVIGYASDTTALSYTDNSISFTTNVNYRGITSDYIERKEGTYLLIRGISNNSSMNPIIAFYDKDKNFIINKNVASQTYGWRADNQVSGAEYVRIYFALNTAGSCEITNVMVDFGTEPNDYEPYGKNEWWLKKAIGKYTFTGSESWSIQSSTDTTTLFNSGTTGVPDISEIGNYGTNYYTNIAGANTTTSSSSDLGSYVFNNTIRFRTTTMTLNDFKTFIVGNYMYYPLATPTYTKINIVDLIYQLEAIRNSKSQNNQTNIFQENTDLAFILNTTAIDKQNLL